MNTRQTAAGLTAALAFAIGTAACATTNHDTLNPVRDIQLHWWRIETPPGFATPMFGCFIRDGIILDPDGNVQITPNDPSCPPKGAPYQLVFRHGTDPAINVGGLRFVPPDLTGEWTGINGRP